MERTSPNLRQETLLVGVITALAAVWRLLYIGQESLWIDEAASIGIARLPTVDFLKVLWRREGNMTLYYLLLRVWVLFGTGEAWVRALSVVFSATTVPFVYLIGRELRDRRTGLLAAVLFAVSPFAVEYAQEARGYSLVCLLVTMASWFLLRAMCSGEKRYWNSWAIATVLGVYAHFFGLLVLFAHLIYMRLKRYEIFRHWPLLTKMMLAMMPVGAFLVLKRLGQLNWVPPLSWPGVASAFNELAGGTDLALLLLPLAVFSGVLYWQKRTHIEFLYCWLLVPIVVILAVSLIQPLLVSRFLIIILPALVLTAAMTLREIPKPISMAMMAVILFFGVRVQMLAWKTSTKDDWRTASAHVLASSSKEQGIIFHQALGRHAFSYYADRVGASNAPTIISPARSTRVTYRDFEGELEERLAAKLQNAPNVVWIMLNRYQPRGAPDDYTRFLLGLTSRSYECEAEPFRGIEVLRCRRR